MSWLARSIANSLKLDDDGDVDVGDSTSVAVDSNAAKPKPVPDQSSLAQSDSSLPLMADSSPRGVKEDISELTKTLSRQFWGVASFLAPPPPAQESSVRGETAIDRGGSEEALIAGIRSDFAEIGGRFKSEISKLSKNIDVSEITKMASDFLQLGSEEESLEKYESSDVVGLTEETIGFARDIAMHPETWLDFPVPDDADFEEFDMSDAQQEHALTVERFAPRLAALRMELCPGYMSDGCFWKIYFVLLHPRLDKHDAELLSTPQIVEARAALMQGLPNRTKSKVEQYQSENSTSKESVDILHEAPSGVSPDSQAEQVSVKTSDIGATLPTGVIVKSETEKHTVQSQEMQIVDKSVIGEGPVAQNKHAYPTAASSSRDSVENPDDEGDDWLKEETSEAVGEGTKTIPITNDEDVSFSDLEDDDDDGVSTSDKRVTSSSYSSTKDSRDWVQLSKTSSDSVKDASVIGDKPATSQVSARNHETKESNDWLDIEEIM